MCIPIDFFTGTCKHSVQINNCSERLNRDVILGKYTTDRFAMPFRESDSINSRLFSMIEVKPNSRCEIGQPHYQYYCILTTTILLTTVYYYQYLSNVEIAKLQRENI